jgi:uncharacterized delta-60 repeat protein
MRSSVPTAVFSAVLFVLGTATARAASGDLDTAWSGNGRATTVVAGTASDAWDLAVQPDDRVVVVGSAGPDFTNTSWGLVRYTPGGVLDQTLSGDGKLTTTWTPGDDEAYAVRVLSSGKLLVAGQAGSNIGIARYTSDGKLDHTFGGGDGKVVTNLTPDQDAAWDIELLAGGKFLIGGDAGDDYVVLRYAKDGTRDMSFGTGGMATAHFADPANGREIAVQPNGKILETGFLFQQTGGFTLALVRFTGGGKPDGTFGGGDGKVLALAGRDAEGWGIRVGSDGKILIAGYARHGDQQDSPRDAAVLRFTGAGKLDPTFGGGDGVVLSDLGDDLDFVLAMAVQGNGKLLLAGSSGDQAVVARVKPSGHLDTTFSGDGVAEAGFAGSAQFWGIGLTSSNRVVASGYLTSSPDPDKYATARFLP